MNTQTQERDMGNELEVQNDGLPTPTIDAASVVAKAVEVANLLAPVLREKGLIANISGKEYVMAEGWTMLAAMMGHSVGTDSTRPVEIDGHAGFITHAKVYDYDGEVVGSADGICTRGEKSWARRDDFALSGMAQTRAISRALRQRFGFVIRLAGYEPTPAEEMVVEEATVPTISATDRQILFDAVTTAGMSKEKAQEIIREIAGVESSAAIPQHLYAAVLNAVHTAGAISLVQETLDGEIVE
jgi:hypothetical protein